MLLALRYGFFILGATTGAAAPENYPLKSVLYNETVCDLPPCVRKCCRESYVLRNKTCVFDGQNAPWTAGGAFLVGFLRCGGVFKLDANSAMDYFEVRGNGKLVRPNKSPNVELEFDKFCLEFFDEGEGGGAISALVCFDHGADYDVAKGLNMIGTMISMPFLLATFVIYLILPERTLHRKSLMSYVITLFLAYLSLALDQLYFNRLGDKIACKCISLLCLFFFLASFFWMNVISIDIWWTFSLLRGAASSKLTERKRFMFYNLHAYGVPFAVVILVGSLTFHTSIPYEAWYNPGFGNGRCWFGDSLPRLLYFYGPVALIILINILLFAVTAVNIGQVEKGAIVYRRSSNSANCFERDKQKYGMYLKLMLAMGINWSMEIVSFLVIWQNANVPQAVWYLTDFCNAVYGAFIFFVFVFKRSTWVLLKKRYYSLRGIPLPADFYRGESFRNCRETSLPAGNAEMFKLNVAN